jgi:hypothetical protein
MQCPKCGNANPDTAEFCITCHAILIHKCPKCWHEQRQGGVCENCGTNAALFLELQVERSMQLEDRIWWDKLWAGISTYTQVVFLPVMGLRGILQSLIARLVSYRMSNR